MERIEIKPRYIRRARDLAAERNKSFEENLNWNNDMKSWSTEPEERNFRGLMGELAFAKYADLQIDTSEHRWSDGGGDFDIEISGQHAVIDVKTSNKEPKALMVKEYAVNADYYVLGHLDGREVTFYGGAWADQITNGVRKESPYGHVNYTLGVDYLDDLPPAEDIVQLR